MKNCKLKLIASSIALCSGLLIASTSLASNQITINNSGLSGNDFRFSYVHPVGHGAECTRKGDGTVTCRTKFPNSVVIGMVASEQYGKDLVKYCGMTNTHNVLYGYDKKISISGNTTIAFEIVDGHLQIMVNGVPQCHY